MSNFLADMEGLAEDWQERRWSEPLGRYHVELKDKRVLSVPGHRFWNTWWDGWGGVVLFIQYFRHSNGDPGWRSWATIRTDDIRNIVKVR